MNDGRIRKKAERIIRKKFGGISVKVEDRVVYLGGKVQSFEDFIAIGSSIGKIKGVRGVVNNISYPGKKERKKKEGMKKKIGKADVVIVGGGVVGCFIARELSRYDLDIVLVEKGEDVAVGTTKANNAMVHTGIGEKMGTLKQKLCVEGHRMYEKVAEELKVPYKKCGMWIITTEHTLEHYRIPSFIANFVSKHVIPYIVLRRGKKLGIPMEIVGRKELLEKEPYVTKKALAAVYSPTYGVTCPYYLTIALAENAIENGVNVMLNTEVVDIEVEGGRVKSVVTTKGTIDADFVINVAGLFADEIAEMAGAREYTIHPKKGSTLLFDREYGHYANHSMSMLKFPRMEHYKGGGIMLTVDGNIQWGPTIAEVGDKEDRAVTSEEIEQIFQYFSPLMPSFPKKAVIAYFAGLRAATFTEDFFIEPSKKVKGFVHVAGIQSPGLAASPAIAKMVLGILRDEGLEMREKENFNPFRKKPLVFRELSKEEKKKAIEKNSLYGKVVCRCEQVTEGEVVDAIHSPIPALSVDAVKRRTRAGMGRCQGSFCLPRIAKIIAREANIPVEEVVKNSENSKLFVGKAKCLLEGEDED
mgnify:CR=1 FL=1